jgi:hypothetical protein
MGWLRRLGLGLIVASTLSACGGDRVAPSGSRATTSSAPISASPPAPSASRAPVASPATDAPPSETTAVVAHSSKRFAYSIEYPAGWVVTPATQDWPVRGFPAPDGAGIDRFGPTADSPAWMYVSSLLLADGESGAGVPIKAKDMDDVRIQEMDSENPLMCMLSDRHVVTVDGVGGREEDQQCFGRDYLIEVLVSNDIRLYLIDVLAHAPLDAADRSRFERFVASFRFGP